MTKMKKLLSLLALVIALLTGGAAAVASAADAVPSPQEEALLELINQARQNPLAMAAAMGMNPEKVLADLPGLEKILKEGIPPVSFNGTLYGAARSHTADMLANDYYSHVSPDGRGYEARIRDAGYAAVASGESLGMLAFANFIDPKEAARFLFEYMYWDELDPSRTEKRNILDPHLKEAGVSVDTGGLRLGGVLWNVYLATCDYGAALSDGENELLNLINAARANPVAAAAAYGIDMEPFFTARPELREVFATGLPPLAVNGKLVLAAESHLADMLANNYYGKTSSDGRTVWGRLSAAGYQFYDAAESLGITWFNDALDPQQAVARLFEGMLRDELAPSGELAVLNPGMTELGVAVGMGILRSDGQEWKVYLAIADVALPVPAEPAGP